MEAKGTLLSLKDHEEENKHKNLNPFSVAPAKTASSRIETADSRRS